MDKNQTLKIDLQKIIDELKVQVKEFRYIGLCPINETSYRLRLKADKFAEMKHFEAMKMVSGLIFDMRAEGKISDDSFFAIRAIDILHPDVEDNDSIPWDIFKLSDEELRRITQLIFHRQTPVNVTPAFPYHYELKPAHS